LTFISDASLSHEASALGCFPVVAYYAICFAFRAEQILTTQTRHSQEFLPQKITTFLEVKLCGQPICPAAVAPLCRTRRGQPTLGAHILAMAEKFQKEMADDV
jgi:hypothetical protein